MQVQSVKMNSEKINFTIILFLSWKGFEPITSAYVCGHNAMYCMYVLYMLYAVYAVYVCMYCMHVLCTRQEMFWICYGNKRNPCIHCCTTHATE